MSGMQKCTLLQRGSFLHSYISRIPTYIYCTVTISFAEPLRLSRALSSLSSTLLPRVKRHCISFLQHDMISRITRLCSLISAIYRSYFFPGWSRIAVPYVRSYTRDFHRLTPNTSTSLLSGGQNLFRRIGFVTTGVPTVRVTVCNIHLVRIVRFVMEDPAIIYIAHL